ncbi:hypothetical protein BC831DRAFT_444375, partial [Entophlyctis helioformis]
MVEDQLLSLLYAKKPSHQSENDLMLFCSFLRAVNSSFLEGHKRSGAVFESAVQKAQADRHGCVVNITPERQPATATARPVNIRRAFNIPTVIARLEAENTRVSKECSVLIEKTLQILKEPLRKVAKLPHEIYAMYGGSERANHDDRIWTTKTKKPQRRSI